MGERTNIEWTDHTFNPWIGCSKVHAGCTHCYAEALMDNRYGKVQWGPSGTRVVTSPANWRKPLTWNRKAKADRENYERAASLSRGEYDTPDPYERPRVFCASLADVFEDWQGPIVDTKGRQLFIDGDSYFAPGRDEFAMSAAATMDDLRRDLFALIDATPQLDWLLLTKRPENVDRMWPCVCCHDTGKHAFNMRHRPNVWLLTSISDQATADAMIPPLLKCRDLCPVLGLSAEPLLGPVDLRSADRWAACDVRSGINWVILGGESGSHARPCDVSAIRSIVDQCKAAGVACFVKQLGANPVFSDRADPSVTPMRGRDGWRTARDSKGGDPDEWPDHLRVREFPEVATVGAGD